MRAFREKALIGMISSPHLKGLNHVIGKAVHQFIAP
jgi:hypothetical protein